MIGVGSGVIDPLRRKTYSVTPFHSSGRAEQGDDLIRFYNARAEAYWALRRKLEEGELAIPRDPLLWEELLNTTWSVKQGKVIIEDKKEIKRRLGRSPDRADALMLSLVAGSVSSYSYGGAAVSF
jgi:hypothetical protein